MFARAPEEGRALNASHGGLLPVEKLLPGDERQDDQDEGQESDSRRDERRVVLRQPVQHGTSFTNGLVKRYSTVH